MGKIFISHSSANNAEALAIDDWLHEQGWADTFLDLDPRRGLVAGERWQAALKSAAESCELILIVISPDWAASRWCLAEFLLAKQMNKQIVGVLVKPTPYDTLPPELTAEWQLVDLTAGKMGWTATIGPPRLPDEKTVSFSEAGLARLSAGLQKAGLDPSHFPWPPGDDPGRAPYRGLLPLDAGDAGIFFGRDGMIVLTLDGLRGLRAKAAPRFATILGASGAGKSSFLRAGLLPRLERDSKHFYVLPIVRPERAALTGEHGLATSLLTALAARNIRVNRADIRNAVLAGADAVIPFLKQIVAPVDALAEPETSQTLVLSIDQAEELLEPGDSAAEAGQLLLLLAELAGRDDPPLLVIFTIRSDGYGRLQDRPELEATKPHHLIDLSPLPSGSYGDVIRGPARRLAQAGKTLTLDEPLVDALLNDIDEGGGKDALPLLAFTLERLYLDYGSDGDLRLSEYEDLGRIRGAIEAAVEQALKSADGNPAIPADRTARLALLRRGLIPWLAGIDPDTRAPRRRVARLSEVPDEARPLMQLMVNQRLLSTDKDAATGETTIEPAHEALLRQWGALDGWLVEDSADLAQLEAVRRAATEWAANGKPVEFLVHKGARLGAAETAADQDKFEAYLNSTDREYLRAAREGENAAIHAARAARLRGIVAAAVVGAVLVIGGIVGFFVWSAGEAAKKLAEANFLIAQSEAALRANKPEDAARAALAAYEMMPGTATRTAALTASMSIPPNAAGLFPPDGRVVDTLWLPGGNLVVLAATGTLTTLDGTGRVLATTKVSVEQLPVGLLSDGKGGASVVYADASIVAPDGTVVAAAPADPFFAQSGTVRSSLDGRLVLIGSLIGEPLLRDCRALPCIDTVLTGQTIPDNNGSAGPMAVKPDGSAFAINWHPGIVAIYRNGTDVPLVSTVSTSGGDTDYGAVMSWSAASDTIAVVSEAGRLWTVDPETGASKTSEIGTSAALAYSPTEPILAMACDSDTICLYDEERNLLATYAGHTGTIAALSWNATGTALVSVAPNDPVRLWSVAQDRRIASGFSTQQRAALTALAVDRQRGIVAVGDEMGNLTSWSGEMDPRGWVRNWSTSSLLQIQQSNPDGTFGSPAGRVAALAFLEDGRLAAVHENKHIAAWQVGAEEPDATIKLDNASFSRIAALRGDIRAVVPLTDKRMIVLSGDGLAGRELAADADNLTPWGVVAAPGDNAVFVSYSDGSIRRRDLGAGTAAAPVYDASQSLCGAEPTTDNNGAKSLDVSDDGKWLVATRTDARVIVHNLADPAKPICIALLAPDSKTVAFSPDATKLAILSATDRLYVFDLAQPDSAIILGAPAVPDNSPLAVAAGPARTTSWLDWIDDQTLAIATTAGSVEVVRLDPASWRARVDSLAIAQ